MIRYDDLASADYAHSLLDALFKLDLHQSSIDSVGMALCEKAEKKSTNALSRDKQFRVKLALWRNPIGSFLCPVTA